MTRARSIAQRQRKPHSRVTPRDLELGQLPLFPDPEPVDMRDRLDACVERAVGPWKEIAAILRGGLNRQAARSLQHRARRRSSAPCRRHAWSRSTTCPCRRHPCRRVDPALELVDRRAVTPAVIAERFIVLVERLEAGISRPDVDEVLDAICAADAVGIAPTALSRHDRSALKSKMNGALRLGGSAADVRVEACELLGALLPEAAAMLRDVVDELLPELAAPLDACLRITIDEPPGALLRSRPRWSKAPPRSPLNR